MNYRMVFSMLGLMLRLESALLLLPTVVALIYRENTVIPFLLTIAITLFLGVVLKLVCKPKDQIVYAKDGFVIVAFAWIILSAFGALPFWFSREIPSYADCFFETVSGFTTTGASILTDVEALSKSILFWRSFTHWIGGMGIIVLIMAIFPTSSGRSMHIMRAEMPGPIVGKLVPRVRDTAKILYMIYIVMTLLQIVILALGDMDLFDSIVHSFGTAGTGGFGVKADSLGSYSSYSQWVITVFMILFGINFNLYYLIIVGKIKNVLKSEELRVYIAIVLVTVAAITLNIMHLYSSIGEAIKDSAFQVSSIMTTTGYATCNFDLWPSFSKTLLFILMFIGGCAGSTAGGFKVSRVILMFKIIVSNIKKVVSPRSVSSVNFEGKALDDGTRQGVMNYLTLYVVFFFGAFVALSFDNISSAAGFSSFETNFSAVAACFNNIGPGFAAVGPSMSFSEYSAVSKIILSFTMLLGRLELYSLIIALLPGTWSRSKALKKSSK